MSQRLYSLVPHTKLLAGFDICQRFAEKNLPLNEVFDEIHFCRTSIEMRATWYGNRLSKQAWHMLTPELVLVETDGAEAIRSSKPFKTMSIEVSLYLPYAMKSYTPFDRFSDGGTDLYTGFFDGDAVQGASVRPLRLSLNLTGLAGETVITPSVNAPGEAGYAYFGPRTPAPAGAATLIMAPRTPEWMAAMLVDTTATISQFYETKFQRKLGYKPLLLLSIGNLDQPGLSIKGGALWRVLADRIIAERQSTMEQHHTKVVASQEIAASERTVQGT